MITRYLINCKYCGALLLKTTQPLVALLETEIKCYNCKKIVKIPEEIITIPEKTKNVLSTLDKNL